MRPNLVARSAVVVIGVLVFVIGAVGAGAAFRSVLINEATDPDRAVEFDRIHHAQFECIRDDVAEQVPPGSLVHVPLDPAAPEADLWKQRLIELAFPVATIVDEAGPGVTTLTVTKDDTGEGCTGVLLVVTPGSSEP